MSESEIEDLIESQNLCRIAFNGPRYPYLAPFRYVRIKGMMYFHFTDYGKKMRLIDRDERVCVQIESYLPDLSEYNFISIRGSLARVEDNEEYRKVMDLFRETGTQLSTNFLAAHGFEPEKGWDEFKEGKDLVFMKLVDIIEKVGLKSP